MATDRYRNGAQRHQPKENPMFRKLTLALIAAASLSIAAFAPSSASASGIHVGIGGIGFHSGWHGGYGHRVYGGPSLYVGDVSTGCMQKRYVETRRGTRLRWVNVCN
jgi:hypothetical protein